MHQRDRGVGDTGSAVSVDLTGDDADQRSAVVGRDQFRVVALDGLVPGRGELVFLRQIHPQLDAVEEAAAFDQFGRRGLDVQDARPRRHPLRGAVGDQAATAVGILVRELAVDHVGDGFESTVRVPIGAPGLARLIFHLTHLVHVHKGIQRGGADPGERPDHRESLALVAPRARW